GQSMIVGPWGNILAERKTGTGWVQAEVDLSELHSIRSKMAVMRHNRFLAPSLK
ncbi:nitrilase-related carbon-nitrogen hydrolase, partial [Shewanella sp.]|uniref:nitrilase-related carbon-nitrogen hydrolase n=1 Tax=Shewanella sp. TaxID=50422 RepID=UPI003F3EF957